MYHDLCREKAVGMGSKVKKAEKRTNYLKSVRRIKRAGSQLLKIKPKEVFTVANLGIMTSKDFSQNFCITNFM